jgi:peptidoglycan/LPS O-acetylase OafA/YrhL
MLVRASRYHSVQALAYRPDIDGLRAIAVLLVVGFHAFPAFVPGGYIGVDVFFVISGFLISGILLDGIRAGEFSLVRFYDRRIRRIFPPLIAVLAAALLYGWSHLLPGEMMQLGKHVAGGAGFVPNFMLWSEVGYFDSAAETKPLLQLWSLGIEEQFYLVWPVGLYLLMRGPGRFRPVVLGLIAISFGWNLLGVYSAPESAFYLPGPRMWELMLGAWLAHVERTQSIKLPTILPILGLLLIAAAAALLRKGSLFPGWWALLPTVGAALLIAAGPYSVASRLLSRSPLAQIGLISYPLYLWHWPLLSFAFIQTAGAPSHTLNAAMVALAVILATLSHLVIERPIRRARRPWQVFGLIGLMAGVGAAGCAVAYYPALRASVLPASVQIAAVRDYSNYDFGTDARLGTCWLMHEPTFEAFRPECFLDARTASEDGILVWGDSHAARLYPGLRSVLGPQANLGQLTRSGCLATLDVGYPNCNDSNARIMAEIRRTQPRTVLVFSACSMMRAGSLLSRSRSRCAPR